MRKILYALSFVCLIALCCCASVNAAVTTKNVASSTLNGSKQTLTVTTSFSDCNKSNDCHGGCNGTATAYVSGGTAPYKYHWSNGYNTSTIINLCGGTYGVTVTDCKGICGTACVSLICRVCNITLSANCQHNLCPGSCTGIIDLTVNGGSAPFSYLWSNGMTTQNVSNLCIGTYSVTVVDVNGCSGVTSSTIGNAATGAQCTGYKTETCGSWCTPPSGNNCGWYLQYNFSKCFPNGITCGGYSGGYSCKCTSYSDVVNCLGYTGTPSQLSKSCINPGSTLNNALCSEIISTELCIGFDNYDPSFCNYNPPLGNLICSSGTFNGWTYQQVCDEGNKALCGKSSYTCQQIYDCLHTCNGNYNNGGCNNGNLLCPCISCFTASLSSTNPTCATSTNGTVTLTINGGTAPFVYTWSNGKTTQNLSGLGAGTYAVTVYDKNNCSYTGSVQLVAPIAITLNTVPNNQSDCSSAVCDGSITVGVDGGTFPYTYKWSNGSTGETATGLCSGHRYYVTVTDCHGCKASTSDTVGCNCNGLTLNADSTNVNCNGNHTGSATVSVVGGNSTYTYIWSNGKTTQTITGLAAAKYYVTVTDVHGCVGIDSTTVNQPTTLTAAVTGTPVNCHGGDNGTATLTVGGGTTAYSFHWSNGASSQNLTGLKAGSYGVTVTDAHGCTANGSVLITQPDTLIISLVGTDLNCHGDHSGGITLNLNDGGTQPFSYHWSNGSSNQGLMFLNAGGTYCVTVTDGNGCTVGGCTTINNPDTLIANVTGTPVSCHGGNNGTVTLTVSGGTTAYTYSWSNGSTHQNLTGLKVGSYGVTVTDAHGCTATGLAVVSQPDTLIVSTVGTNLTCHDDHSGGVTLSTNDGGTNPYTYHWSNGASSQNLMLLNAGGTYCVTVTDGNGCTVASCAAITNPDTLIANVTGTPVNCHGGNNGTATLAVSGGTTAYTYSWSNGATSKNLTGLKVGSYGVTVTDAHGCTAIGSVAVTQPDTLIVSTVGTNLTCHDDHSGGVTLSTNDGGTSPYTYHWSNGASSQNLMLLNAGGTYCVTVTDGNGCTVASCASITNPDTLIASIQGNNPNCHGGNDGFADLTVIGGTTAYSYNWSNGASTQDITGLTAGNYSVTVTDAHGCSALASVIITAPDTLIATATGTNATCHDGNNGSVTLTVSGGTSGYTFHWSNNATTQNISNLQAGTYSATVTDAHGCTATTGNVVISSPDTLTSGITSTNVTCYDAHDGTITLTVNGGTTPYTFNWSNGATTQNLTGLAISRYSVTITDAKGCSDTASVRISGPGLLTAEISKTDVTCHSGDNGTLTLSVNGGTTPYTYNWTNGDTTQDLTGLTAGSYSVTVTDAHNCTATANATILQPDTIIATTTHVNGTLCSQGNCNGSINLTVTGGASSTYTYNWSNGATTQNISGLCQARYYVTITDINGCNQFANDSVSCCPSTITITKVISPALAIAPEGGWNFTSNIPGNSTFNIAGTGGTLTFAVAPGTYTITEIPVSTWSPSNTCGPDTNIAVIEIGTCTNDTCTFTNTKQHTPPACSTPIPVTVDSTDISCNGSGDGKASVTANVGVLPYTYLWSTGATTSSISGLSAGTYCVTITDAQGCTGSGCTSVNEPGQLLVTAMCLHNNCTAQCMGQLQLSVFGGTSPYTFNWTNDEPADSTITGLCDGLYTVTVTDAHGCTVVGTFEIHNNTPLSATTTATNSSSCSQEGCDGTVTVYPTGATPPYGYLWSTGATTQEITGLCKGRYYVTVTDSHGYGCAVFTANDTVGCNCTGSITITKVISPVTALPPSNGWNFTSNIPGAATFIINGSGGTQTFNNIPNGTYTITEIPNAEWTPSNTCGPDTNVAVIHVTSCDNYPCTFTNTERHTPPACSTPIPVTVDSTDISCNGSGDGKASVTANVGVLPYTYLWSTGATTSSISGLSAGTYCVTITDAQGCTGSGCTSVNEPGQLLVTAMCLHNNCTAQCMGQLQLSVFGGTSPYTFNWTNDEPADSTITGLCDGLYTVTVTDAHGCTVVGTFEIHNNTPLSATTTATKSSTCSTDGCDGTVTVYPTGATPPYGYLWSTGATTQEITGLCKGRYYVTVTDSHGYGCAVFTANDTVGCNCTGSITITKVISPVTALPPSNGWNFTSNIPGAATFIINGSGGTQTFNNIPNGTYTITEIPNAEWTPSNTCGPDTNVAVIHVTSCDNYPCTFTNTERHTPPACSTPIPVTVDSTDISCNGSGDGKASVTANVGVLPYTYLWSTGATTSSISGLSAGTYCVTITDAQGCTGSGCTSVNEPGQLLVTAMCLHNNCTAQCMGQLQLSVFGGTSPYTFNWTNDEPADSTITGLCDGLYTVTVTDAHGCTVVGTFEIHNNTPLSATTTATNSSSCSQEGCDGTVTVYPTGATPPYGYLWSTGATTQEITGLCKGRYYVTVTDSHGYGCAVFTANDTVGCNCTGSITINKVLAPENALGPETPWTFTSNIPDNGTFTINGSGGTQTFNNIPLGTYTVTEVSNPNWTPSNTCGPDTNVAVINVEACQNYSCTFTNTAKFRIPCTITIALDSTNVACHDALTGSASVSIVGGAAAASYTWSNGATTQSITGLGSGSYSVTVTDVQGCTGIGSTTVNQPDTLTASVIGTPVSCHGGDNGTATLTVVGGTQAYTYNWSNGATTQNLTGLTAATYGVTVTDAHGCVATGSVVISQPDTLIVTLTPTDLKCHNDHSGGVILQLNEGGTPQFTFHWSNGSSNNGLMFLNPGQYCVTITDANGCTTAACTTVSGPDTLTASVTGTPVSCYGSNNGTATLTVTGGTTAYTYSWSNGATTQNLTGIKSGTYSVVVTDAHGCTANGSVFISQPDTLTASVTGTPVSCYGSNNGTATLTVTGGTTAYTYSWSNGATTQNLTGIKSGTYSVVVTDAHGCTANGSVFISQPDTLTASVTGTPVSCYGSNNGTATLTVTGGTTAYTYSWSNGATTQNLTGIKSGTYSVVVTDAHGCTANGSVFISQPDTLTASVTGTPVSCYGSNNGTATLTVTGGTTAYTYSWSNGATTQNLTGIKSGTYSVVVTDAHGCTANGSVFISQPDTLTASIVGTNVNCNGNSNGTATLTVTGGTTAYTYNWSNGATTQNLTGLEAAVYSVTVTDAHGCQDTASVRITQPAPLQCFIICPPLVCSGNCNGVATVSEVGGTAPYSFHWNTGASDSTISNLCAGVYTATVTDANGCTCQSSVQLSAPPALVVTTDSTNASCHGSCDGTATANASGGKTPYTYSWSNGQTTSTATGLCGGITYTVAVTDSNGCSQTRTVTISQPDTLTASVTGTPVSCYGSNNGTATLTVTGGTTAYTYSWSNGATTQNLTGIKSGTYSVVVTDAHGCTANGSVFISQPDTLTASVTGTPVSCYGSNNGTATLTVTGGTTAYTYNWSNGATTQNLTGIKSGTYSVVVTDAHGCTANGSVFISQPDTLTASVTGTPVSCYGSNNGTATLTVTGGTTAYTYSWSNGATTQNLTGIKSGTYSVVVTDAHGCTANGSVFISQPDTLTASVTGTPVSCYGSNNGTATLTVTGGTTAYTYSWSNGATTQNLTGIKSGTYSVVVTDAHGCTATGSVFISQPDTLTASAVGTPVTCHGGNDGSAILTVVGGTSPYSYLWSNGSTSKNLNNTSFNIKSGTYSVVVFDAHGCTASASVFIGQPDTLIASVTGTPVNCHGGNDGSATLTVTGGTTAYTYSWSNGATTQNLTGIKSGTYSVVVTDAHGCTANGSVFISQPDTLTASVTGTPVSCYGSNNGTATLTVTGGTTAYTYSWSNGATTQNLTGIKSGTYSVVVTDAHGCTATGSVFISQPDTLTASVTGTPVSCYGSNNGTATLTVTGGTTAYTYSWSNGATTQNLTGIKSGTYSVVVTDAHGCTATGSVFISQPDTLTASIVGTNVNCNGNSNGTATLTVTGGTTAYTYNWSNGATTQNLTGLEAAVYSVTVTDAHGCQDTASVRITQPAPLQCFIICPPLVCSGNCNGVATVSEVGGTAPYSFHWNTGASDSTISNLCAGVYTATVTDANGCTCQSSVQLSAPPALVVTTDSTNASCHGSCDGTATANASGGKTPYTYSWSNGQTTSTATGLCGGITYTVAVTDSNGCSQTRTVTISQPDTLTASVTGTPVSCYGSNNGTATLTVTGGTTAYTYSWSNGATTQNLTGIKSGTYSVVVTDAHGCTANGSVFISQPDTLTASVTGTPVSCYGSNNGTATLTVTGGTTAYTYNWSNGATTQNLTGIKSGTYSVVVTDAHGCTANGSVFISQPDTLTASVTGTPVSCYGSNNGTATLTVTGGTTAYTYSWSNGATTQNLTGIKSGTYSVVVTDAHGCTANGSVFISQPDTLTASVTGTPVSCYGSNNGTATLTVTGGTTAYTYSWSNGATTQNLTGIKSGTYSVVVTDAHGCTATGSVFISQPDTLTASAVGTPVTCHGGNDGSAILTVVGGTSPYSYLWSNGSTSKNLNNTSFNIKSGTYSVVVFDAHGCTASASVFIGQPDTLIASVTGTPVNCHGGNDGSATLTVTGGTTAYTYSWSNGATTQNLTGIKSGTYSVVVTDAHGCTANGSVFISQPDTLTASVTGTPVSCYGSNNGTATLTVTGGTTAYTYSWSNGATTQNLTGIKSGTYSVVVTDAHGCTATGSVFISQPDTLTASVTGTPVSCYGSNNGTATLTVTGGTTAYTYSWSNGATTQNLTGIKSGTYSVVVTDAHGCTANGSVFISQPDTLTASVTGTPVSCYGSNNGTATLTVTGGTTAYTYNWSNGATTQNLTGIKSGTYSVVVTDAHGCTANGSVFISQPDTLTASVTGTPVSCYGSNNGTATLTVTGGTTAYTYSWSNGATTQNLTGIKSGTYSVVVTDAHGCTANGSVFISQPDTLTASIVGTNVNCNGNSNGTATLTVNGGTTAYTYNWSNGATTQNLTGLEAAVYSVTVTDAHGCQDTASVRITQPAPLQCFIICPPLVCSGNCNGVATVSEVGGTAPYSFHWNTGASDSTISNLCAGVYTATVTDANGCTCQSSVQLSAPPALVVTTDSTNASCHGSCDGTATANASGGKTPYTYSWSNGQTTSTATGLCGGITYTVAVTDSNGCSQTRTVTISQPDTLTASVTGTPVSCYGSNNGTATLTVTGGTTAYTYSWSNGATTQNLTGIKSGTYSVVVTDAHGCTANGSVFISQPDTLTASIVGTNVNCNGNSNGTATLTVNGGTTAYTYNWSNGATTQNLTGLEAAVYSVTVTDAHGCQDTASVRITQPAPLQCFIICPPLVCSGNCNGVATVSEVGGTAPYSFHWNTGASDSTISNLCAGVYTATVTDANGCTCQSSVQLSAPPALVVTTDSTNASCHGSCDGTATANASGGKTPYTYSWSNGQTTSTATGLCGGITYTVAVTDSNGCSQTRTVTISQPDTLTASVTGTPVSCYGSNNGTATLTVTGGTTAYTYSWSNGATTQNLTGIKSGTYSVVVTDAHGCTANGSVFISQPDTLTASIVGTNVNCNGNSNGTATLTVNGGTTAYTYNWSNGATTQNLTGLEAAVYSVTVTDAHGCQDTASVRITQPAPLQCFIICPPLVCSGNCNGVATVSEVGGTAPYSFHWNTGASDSTISNLCAGVYTATVTDANGCTCQSSVQLSAPPALVVTTDSTNASCHGSCDGTATANASGGKTPYTYSWSNGQTTSTATGLCGGITYTVAVTDSNGCSQTRTVTISQPDTLTASVTGTPVSCYGSNNGMATLTVTGGTTAYTYSWSNGATTQNLTGIKSGTYSVVVTDAHGCTATGSVFISQPDTLTASVTGTPVSCHGGNDGTATLTVVGGTQAYTYSWSNGATTQNLTGIKSGMYNVVVTDAHGCTANASVTIMQPDTLIATVTGTNVTCHNSSDGTATLTVSGGTSITPGEVHTYNYIWSNGATTKDLTGLVSGGYCVTVTDAHGCSATGCVFITEPDTLIASLTGTPVSCYGSNNGTATLTVTGGTTAYTYSWSNGATTQNLTGIKSGTYSVVVTDAHGCTANGSVFISQPDTLTASVTGTPVSCYGSNNGTATLTVTGGTTAYTYNWSNGATTQNLTGIKSGTYSVVVTDAHGCTANGSVFISQPDTLTASVTGTPVSCYGSNNGTATLTVTGGTTAYTYSWSNGATTQNLTGIKSGTYSVVVTDAHGCTANGSVFISQPDTLTASVTGTPVSCYGSNNGTATLTVTGGTTAYTYSWSNGATTQNLTGIKSGTYSVVVTDAHGCTANGSVFISQPDTLTASVTGTPVSCYGSNNGTATLTVTGGTTAYTYSWSNGATTQNLTGIKSGTYSVVVTDAHGCTANASIFISQPDTLTASVTGTPVSCYGSNNGTATLTVTGGTTAYTYSWSNGATTQNLTGIKSGTYSVVVTDAHGCTANGSVFISQPDTLTASVTGTPVSCYGSNNGTATLTVTGGTTAYTYSWSNGATTQNLTGIKSGTYSVVVTDAHGCTANASIFISQPDTLTASVTGTPVSCYGSNNGTATLTVTGGTTAYTYSWSNGATTQNLTGIKSGTYSVVVTDAHGCTANGSVFISQPDTLTASVTGTPVSCFSGSNGTATLTVTGGTQAYTFNWSNGATTQNLSNLASGRYGVTVTDAHGCRDTASVFISTPTALSLTPNHTDETCFQACNGTAGVGVTGGIFPYTYNWSNGSTASSVTGLCGGNRYGVTVTDANGCRDTLSVRIGQPGNLLCFIVCPPLLCPGNCNGVATVSETGGTAPYHFHWNTGATDSVITGLCTGVYTATVTDANGCFCQSSVQLTSPTPITYSTTATNGTQCSIGNCNGSINLTVNGGTTPYTFNWSNGATTQNISGLCQGRYYVTITDANGCIKTTNDTVSCCSSTITITKVLAPLTALPPTGKWHFTSNVPGYATFTIDSAGGTFTLTDVPNGMYTVTEVPSTDWVPSNTCAIDSNDASITVNSCGDYACTFTNTVRHTPPCLTPFAIALDSTNVSCHGAGNGTVSITAIEGVSPYTFVWSNNATTQNLSGLSAGTYCVTVFDSHGCTGTGCISVNEPDTLTASIIGTGVRCHGDYSGSATLTVVGGTPAYHYHWSNGASTQNLTGINAGTYSVTVTDAHGCTALASVIIGQPDNLVAIGTVKNIPCNSQCSGSVTLTVTGGTLTYSYHWSNGASTQNISNLCAGPYNVTVTDAHGCVTTGSFTITDNPAVVLITSYSDCTSSGNCHDGCNGSVSVSASGGTTPYAYNWSNGATTATVSSLCGGTYGVTVTDKLGCTKCASVTIVCTPQCNISLTTSYTHCTSSYDCHTGCNGTVSVTASNGVTPYSYYWSTGDRTASVSGLCGGTYTVTVTDHVGCTKTASVTITCIPQCNISLATSYRQCTSSYDCHTGCNGTASVTASGGVTPYSYYWSTGDRTASVSGLCGGTYTVTVTDHVGCTKTASVTFTCVPQCNISLATSYRQCTSSYDCHTGCNGTASVTASGGVTPYSYYWSTGDRTASVSGLCGGTYTVTVTDHVGCTKTASVTFTCVPQCNISVATSYKQCTSSYDCHTGCNGTASVTASGGVTPYSYYWSTGDRTASVSSLCGGTYTVTVTDHVGCSKTASVTFTCIPQCNISLATSYTQCTTSTDCHNGCNGTASVTASNGVTPYSYYWSTGDRTSGINSLCGGTYTVTVTDHVGCTKTASVTITCIHECNISLSCSYSNCSNYTDCYNGSGYNGSCTASCENGVAPYSYHWSNGCKSSYNSGVCGGTYTVTVTDGVGCTKVCNVCVQNTSDCNNNNNNGCSRLAEAPETVQLTAAPNPFITSTSIEMVSSDNAQVTLGVYNVMGVKVGDLYNGAVVAQQKYSFNYTPSDNNAAGVYFVRLKTDSGFYTEQIIQVK